MRITIPGWDLLLSFWASLLPFSVPGSRPVMVFCSFHSFVEEKLIDLFQFGCTCESPYQAGISCCLFGASLPPFSVPRSRPAMAFCSSHSIVEESRSICSKSPPHANHHTRVGFLAVFLGHLWRLLWSLDPTLLW